MGPRTQYWVQRSTLDAMRGELRVFVGVLATIPLGNRRRLTVALTRVGLRAAFWRKCDAPLWRDGGGPDGGVREPRRPRPGGSSGTTTAALTK